MHTFFHGRRRKAGLVALGLALAVMGVDLRSRLVRDQMTYWIESTQWRIASDSGTIQIASADWPGFDYAGYYEWPRFEIAGSATGHQYARGAFLYSAITVPLIALTILLLWPQRKPPKQPSPSRL